ncbi:hypothetical protein PsYK624_148740 [Phanerochaete sordida]|uniref:Uncharacterized protein n=1 Tax=Phanerochaete sordida TaxID=48140 RepID=A0A9P3GQS6_9APHY|nr:hypothetical protein PsYK624_148740 [Phanerochaete sordida]
MSTVPLRVHLVPGQQQALPYAGPGLQIALRGSGESGLRSYSRVADGQNPSKDAVFERCQLRRAQRGEQGRTGPKKQEAEVGSRKNEHSRVSVVLCAVGPSASALIEHIRSASSGVSIQRPCPRSKALLGAAVGTRARRR